MPMVRGVCFRPNLKTEKNKILNKYCKTSGTFVLYRKFKVKRPKSKVENIKFKGLIRPSNIRPNNKV